MDLKILLVVLALLFMSCSVDEDETANCEMEVWGMSSQGNNNTYYYEVEYGSDEDNTTTVEVNKATYEYYAALFEDSNDHNDCWEGMK